MRRLPVGMLVGGAEPRHPERRRIGERAAEIGGRGPGARRSLEGVDDRGRIVGEKAFGQRRVIRPAARRRGGREEVRAAPRAARSHRAIRSTGWRHAVDSSAPRAAAIWPTTLGSTSAACSQPMTSRHSKALLMKSSECPPSA